MKTRSVQLAWFAVWLAGLAILAALASALVAGYRSRTRGVPEGFPAPVSGADVPTLGANVALEQYDDSGLEAALSRIAEAGFVWVRQSFYWSEIEPEPGRFDWGPADRIVEAIARHPPLRLIAVLEDRPPTPPEEPERFAAYAGEFASRYGERIDDYQIWDEPNLGSHWGGGPVSAPAYADLLARSARAIRASDGFAATTGGPEARILLAGLAPNTETGPQNLGDVRYLDLLYLAGAGPYFDVVAGKPYGFDTGPDDRRADADVLNFSRLILLHEVMQRHADEHKAVWASNWGWNALPAGWSGTRSIWGQTDEAAQAARTVSALERARTEWPWAGALMLENYQPHAGHDDARWGFALVGQDGEPRPVFEAVAGWSRALPHAAPPGAYPADNSWTRYEGAWQVGPLAADIGAEGDRATFRFDGPSVALTVRRAPYRANVYVTVDGQPANALPSDREGRSYIVLYDDTSREATVPLATGLPPGEHTVKIVAEGGWDQWAIVDWRVGTQGPRDGLAWQLAVFGAAALGLGALLVRDVRRVEWSELSHAFAAWPGWAQSALAAALTATLWAALAGAVHLLAGAGASTTTYAGLTGCLVYGFLALSGLGFVFALRPDLGLCLAAATAPLYLVPSTMIYRALSMAEILLLLCAAGLAVRRHVFERQGTEARLRLTPMDWAVAGFVLAAALGTALAGDMGGALLEFRTVFLLPVLIYVLLRVVRPGRETARRIVIGWALGGVAVAAIGLAQYALGTRIALAEGGLPRLRSVYYSPNSVALYLGRIWPMLLAAVVWARDKRFRWPAAISLAIVGLALALSFSRGALLLGLPAAVLVMGWWAGGRYRWVALGFVVVGALALIPLMTVPRFASLLDTAEGSTFFRLELWRSTVAMIRDHPMLGVGPGQFSAAYRTRYILPAAWSEPNLTHPHNILLDLWTRLGVAGLVAFVAMQWAFWRALWLQRQDSTDDPGYCDAFLIGLAGSMTVLLAHGLVDNTIFSPDVAMAFFLTLGLAPLSRCGKRRGSPAERSLP